MKKHILFFIPVLFSVVVLGFFLTSCGEGLKTESRERPNIIFIMADDHANRAISAYGSGTNHTPNIDRLADEGAIFFNSFCANSICGPSRASILTGKHSHLNGVTGNGAPWDGSQSLFPRLMKNAGYQSVLFGKWHLNSNPGDEFDYWKILLGAGKQGFYYNPYFVSSDKGGEDMKGYSTDIITDEAINWLNHGRDKKKPFLLFVQYKSPHVPRMPPLRLLNKYINDTIPEPETFFDDFSTRSHYAKDVNFHINNYRPWPRYEDQSTGKNIHLYLDRMTEEERRAYHNVIDPQNEQFEEMKRSGLLEGDNMKRYAYQRFIKDYLRCVDAVDENVGRLLSWLDKHQKLRENTVVVYCGDQSYFTGEHGYAEKRLMYEEALKMPLLIRWPDVIDAGTEVDALIQNLDYAPTFLDIAGVDIPDEMQGKSFKPILEGAVPQDWRQSIYYHYYDHGRHKVGRHDGIRTVRYKLINFYTDDTWELYDLETDPHEVNNVYGNSDFEEISIGLKEELQLIRKKYKVPEWVFSPPYVSLKGIGIPNEK